MRLRLSVLCLLGAGLIVPQAVGQSVQYRVSGTKYLMGTRVETTVVFGDVEAAQNALVLAGQEMERVEALLSSHKEGSDIDRINQGGAHGPVRVEAETLEILQRARDYSERLDGVFDITTAPALDLWGLGDRDVAGVPSEDELEAVTRLIDYRGIILNPADSTVRLAHPGMKISLGGIAKGYAVDRAAAVLRASGVSDFMINAGGDIFVAGEPRIDDPWKVGIQHPRDSARLIARIQLQAGAVATSGDYERFVEYDGQRYPHIIDPRNGRPSTRHRSASAIAPTAEEADVLATYLFVTGSLASWNSYLVVSSDGSVLVNGQDGPSFELVPSD